MCILDREESVSVSNVLSSSLVLTFMNGFPRFVVFIIRLVVDFEERLPPSEEGLGLLLEVAMFEN